MLKIAHLVTGFAALLLSAVPGLSTSFLTTPDAIYLALIGLFKLPFRFGEVLKQLRFIGAGSITVIFFTSLSTGMVLGLQGYSALNRFGADGMLGSVVALSLIMELGPTLTAIMVAGRAGSARFARRRENALPATLQPPRSTG